MRVVLTELLLDRDGKPIQLFEKPLTFSRAIVSALDGPADKISSEDKIKRYKLACRIQDEMLPVELSIEEAALIQKVLNEFFTTPLIICPIHLALERATEAEKAAPKKTNGEDKHAH